MKDWISALTTWWNRRRRFAEEWEFHLAMAEAEWRSLGLGAAEARLHARRRLGSPTVYRREAMRELGADLRGLLDLLPLSRARRSPLLPPAFLVFAAAVLLALNPQRAQVFESLRPILPLARSMAVERWMPLTPPGVVPIGLATLVLWTFAGVGIARLTLAFGPIGQWRIRAYGALILAGLAFLLGVGGTTALQLLLRTRWHADGPQGLALILYGFAFPGLAWRAMAVWWHDLQQRCPRCLGRLGLHLGQGGAHNILIDPAEMASICLNGHGQAIATRWQRSFACDVSPLV